MKHLRLKISTMNIIEINNSIILFKDTEKIFIEKLNETFKVKN